MKKNMLLSFLLVMAAAGSAQAADSILQCTGSSEFDHVIIKKLTITKEKITLLYASNDEIQPLKTFITTEFMIPNGQTDLNKPAHMIGGSFTGIPNDYDDISLPHLGVYRSGFGSEIAFNYGGVRVVGFVTCVKR